MEYEAAQNVIVGVNIPKRHHQSDNPDVNILISREDEMTQVSSDGSLSWLRFLMKDLEYVILDLYTHNGNYANSNNILVHSI